MKPVIEFYASTVPNPGLPGTYFATFRVPGGSPQWLMERGSRQVFTSRDLGELAAYRVMMIHLNEGGASASVTKQRTDKAKIKGWRADGVGKGSSSVVEKQDEASVVFANFKKGG